MTAPASEARASTPDDDARRDALSGRLFEAMIGAIDLMAVQLGIELGLYAALRDAARRPRPSSPSGPGSTPGMPVSGWSSRPWAASSTWQASDDADARRFALPAGHARRCSTRTASRPWRPCPRRAGRGTELAGPGRRVPVRRGRRLERVPAHVRGAGGGQPPAVPAPPRERVAPRDPRRGCPAAAARGARRGRRVRRRLVDDRDGRRVPGRQGRGPRPRRGGDRAGAGQRGRGARRPGRGSTSCDAGDTASTARSTS